MAKAEKRTHKMSDLDPHSERLSESYTAKQQEEMDLERSRPKPHGEQSWPKPHELATTSRSEMDELIEAHEGKQIPRSLETMALHEELSRTGKSPDEEWRVGRAHPDSPADEKRIKRPRIRKSEQRKG